MARGTLCLLVGAVLLGGWAGPSSEGEGPLVGSPPAGTISEDGVAAYGEKGVAVGPLLETGGSLVVPSQPNWSLGEGEDAIVASALEMFPFLDAATDKDAVVEGGVITVTTDQYDIVIDAKKGKITAERTDDASPSAAPPPDAGALETMALAIIAGLGIETTELSELELNVKKGFSGSKGDADGFIAGYSYKLHRTVGGIRVENDLILMSFGPDGTLYRLNVLWRPFCAPGTTLEFEPSSTDEIASLCSTAMGSPLGGTSGLQCDVEPLLVHGEQCSKGGDALYIEARCHCGGAEGAPGAMCGKVKVEKLRHPHQTSSP